MEHQYTLLDLSDILRDSQVGYRAVGTLQGNCVICDERVSQNVDACGECGFPVVWVNSPVWKRLYGSPTMRIRSLEGAPAESDSGKFLLEGLNLSHFATQAEQKQWARGVRVLGETTMKNIAEYIVEKHKGRGRAGIVHTMNLVAKRIREKDQRTWQA